MTHLLRVKRKIGESSVHSLAPVKRCRLSSGGDGADGSDSAGDSATPVFQYIGTVSGAEQSLPQHVLSTVSRAARCGSRSAAEGAVGGGQGDRRMRVARERRQSQAAAARAQRRFQVVSSRRCTSPLPLPAGVTLLDAAETVITCNGESLAPADFVYDLYLCTEPVQCCDGLELGVFGDDPPLWQPSGSSEDEAASSDSNAENHWRNDYPDEDVGSESGHSAPGSSDYLHEAIGDDGLETDLVRRLNDFCHVAGDSSEDSDAGLGEHGGPRRGHGYDCFKRRVLRQMEEYSEDDEDDSNSSF